MEPPAPGARDPAPEPVAPQPLPASPHELGYAVPDWQPPIAPPPVPPRPNLLKRVLAPIAAAGAVLAKWGAILLKLKAFTLFGSVAISIAAYTLAFGFTFALGFVGLIFAHEMGHFVYFGLRGMRPRFPVFVPLLGAYTSAEKAPTSVFDEAMSALAGPALGMAAAGVVGWRAHDTHSTFLYALAFIGFFLNLVNLVPLLPFDGGHAAVALHPAVSVVGLAILLVFELRHPTVFLLVFLLLGGYVTWQRYKHRDQEAPSYRALSAQQRAAIVGLYLGLIAVGLWGESFFYLKRTF